MRPTGLNRKGRRRRGAVLVASLVIVVMLASVLLEFNYETRVSLRAAQNGCQSLQALYCAESGLNVCIAAVRTLGGLRPDSDAGRLLMDGVTVPVGEGQCVVSAAEENGRINVNMLRDADGSLARSRVDQMLKLIDLLNRQYGERSPVGYGIVPAIIDWVDADDEVVVLPFVARENEGAEDEYYMRLQPPHRAGNAPFDTVGELMLIRGMTSEIFHGRPADPAERLGAADGMRRFVTVYGDGRIDINHAPAAVLLSLSDRMDDATVGAIVAERQRKAFESTEELRRIPGVAEDVYAGVEGLLTARPGDCYYEITATGVVGDFSRTIRAVVRKVEGTNQISVVMREEL